MTVDDLRALAPQVGFALYAWAGEPVALELHFSGGAYHALRGVNEAAVVAEAAALLSPVVAGAVAPADEIDETGEDVFA